MKNHDPIHLIAVCGTVATILLALILQSHDEGHEHNMSAMQESASSTHEHHEPFIVTNPEKVPTVDLKVFKDPKAGWNAQLTTSHFRFTPKNAGRKNRANQGHAHLYVNGVKLARVYGSWFHIATLKPGEYEITASLNANDHSPYMYENEMIEDTEVLLVQ